MQRLPEVVSSTRELCEKTFPIWGAVAWASSVEGGRDEVKLVNNGGGFPGINWLWRELLEYEGVWPNPIDSPIRPGHWAWRFSVKPLGATAAVSLQVYNCESRFVIPKAIVGGSWDVRVGSGVEWAIVDLSDGSVYVNNRDAGGTYIPPEDGYDTTRYGGRGHFSRNGVVTAVKRPDGWVDITAHFGAWDMGDALMWDSVYMVWQTADNYFSQPSNAAGDGIWFRHHGVYVGYPIPEDGYWPLTDDVLGWMAATDPDGWTG